MKPARKYTLIVLSAAMVVLAAVVIVCALKGGSMAGDALMWLFVLAVAELFVLLGGVSGRRDDE